MRRIDVYVRFAVSDVLRLQSFTDSPNTSSTYSYIKSNSSFDDGYTQGSAALNVSGDWVSDDVHINGVKVTGLQFGIAYNTTQTRESRI